MSPRCVVVGGGVAGLTAAYRLTQLPGAPQVSLVEASDRLGGKLRTEHFAGVALDVGADSFLARVPEALGLANELGLRDSVVDVATAAAAVLVGGRLRPLPARTVLGVPTDLAALRRARVLSHRGLARAAAERVLPARPVTASVSVADYVGARFGREVVDRLVEPLLGGVYAGRASTLDLDATLPKVAEMARRGGSLLAGLRDVTGEGQSAAPVFHGLRGGMSGLVTALARAVEEAGGEISCGAPAAQLERVGQGWRLTLTGGRALVADAVVLATPAPVTARLLATVDPAASTALAGIDYASVAIIALALRRNEFQAAGRSGFLVATGEPTLLKACTFSSTKWRHLDEMPDTVLVRCSVGRAGDTTATALEDDELVAGVVRDLGGVLGRELRPQEVRVVRWPDALPQYRVGHPARVAEIRAATGRFAGLGLAGAAYDGVGIPACIRSGTAAAAQVATALGWDNGHPARHQEDGR